MTFTSLRRAFTTAAIASGLIYGQAKAPQPKSQKERDALMKVQTAAQSNNADEEIKAIDYVLENFDNTDYKPMLLTMGMEAAQAKGDAPKASLYADRLIEVDPNNIAARVMQAEAIAQRTRENDLDKEQSLKRVDELANKGLELLKNASTPPPGTNEAQWPQMKNQFASEAHDALGQAADLRKNYPEAIKHYQDALQAEPTNAVVTARLAKAYVGNKQYDEAIAAADKVAAMSDAPAVVKQFAQQQKDAATKLKGAGRPRSRPNLMPAALEVLEEKLGYQFRSRSLLLHALTHRSWSVEHREEAPGRSDNERLEFLGDSVLGFVVSEALLDSFPDESEGNSPKGKPTLSVRTICIRAPLN